MNKTTGALLLATVALTACVSAPRGGNAVATYDFGLPAARPADERNGAKFALDVRTPGWFDSLHVDYRLAYDDPLKPREYADSRWAANPGTLLQRHLSRRLGVPSEAPASRCLLRVDVQEFSQVFDTPRASNGVLQASVSVFGERRVLLAERDFLLRRPASSADASGGVKALVAASDDLAEALAEWLRQDAAFGACR